MEETFMDKKSDRYTDADGLVWVKPSRRLTKAEREYYRVSWNFWKRHESTPTWDGKPTDEDHAKFSRGMDYFARTGYIGPDFLGHLTS
jgi:hypothetical protein